MGAFVHRPVEAAAQVGSALSMTRMDILHPQPQPPLPDVLVWMLSGRRRVAWARIPAQDVLFSVVEEERGRDCGKIQSLLLSVRGVGCWRLEWGESSRAGAGERGHRVEACGS